MIKSKYIAFDFRLNEVKMSKKKSNFQKNGFVYLIIASTIFALILSSLSNPFSASTEISVTETLEMIADGKVKEVVVQGEKLTIIAKDGSKYFSSKESGISLLELMKDSGIDPLKNDANIVVKGRSGWGTAFNILFSFLPIIFFGGLILFMMRQAQGGANQTFGFGKSKARKFTENKSGVTFKDVAGVEEEKIELAEIVEFLQEPAKFIKLGAKVPKGVLLVGPPGTGKTLLAKAVAGEAAVPFYSISGSEFVEMFVGVGASRVRDLFGQAKINSPCIIFIDEIDAVGRHRGSGLGGGHDEREQTLNQILVEMDGFESGGFNIIIIAATNRPDILDPALLRPGRFDRRVVLDVPDMKSRTEILKVHSQGKPIEDGVDLSKLSEQTPGFSGADLANLMNESAILAARRKKDKIGHDDFAESIDRVLAGPAKMSKILSKQTIKVTACHEVGHALCGHLLPEADSPVKVSIISRGHMGGYTRFLPDDETALQTKKQLEARIVVALGGRAAEEVVLGEITTGASNDMEQATKIARTMIMKFGMSDILGPRTMGKREETVFLGREVSEQKDYSESLASVIDEEVKELITSAYEKSKSLIKDNIEILNNVVDYLIINETIEGETLTKLLSTQS
jgi:cell division protease FtsH